MAGVKWGSNILSGALHWCWHWALGVEEERVCVCGGGGELETARKVGESKGKSERERCLEFTV